MNPQNGQPFKRGDEREDGYLFCRYTNRLKADGTFVEIWLTPESLNKVRVADNQHHQSKYNRTSDRLPKGWRVILRSKVQEEECRRLYRAILRGKLNEADLLEFTEGLPVIRELLLPLVQKNGV